MFDIEKVQEHLNRVDDDDRKEVYLALKTLRGLGFFALLRVEMENTMLPRVNSFRPHDAEQLIPDMQEYASQLRLINALEGLKEEGEL